MLRGEFQIEKPVTRARLYATAHGIYEAHLNGQRVGDFELTPGFTEYRHRVQVQTYDVTDLVTEGPNALGAILADGWYRGQVGMMRLHDQFGTDTAYLAQLHVDHPDGTTTVVGTDDTWRSRHLPHSVRRPDRGAGRGSATRRLYDDGAGATRRRSTTPTGIR